MNTLTHCELKQVVAGVLPRNHFHHQTEPQAGICERMIEGGVSRAIFFISTPDPDFRHGNRHSQEEKDSERGSNNNKKD